MNKLFSRRNLKWALILLIPLLLCGSGYYWVKSPHYLVLDIPRPDILPNYYVDDHTSSLQQGVQTRLDDDYFVWRQETTYLWRDPNRKADETLAAFTTYYNQALLANGWQLFEYGHDSCKSTLAESHFLTRGKSYWVYKRLAAPYPPAPAICFAIWQGTLQDELRVVLVTTNPSVLTNIRHFDHNPGDE